MITIAFFNNKGGVGNTSLVYHLAWMFQDLGLSVVAADFDPQANLTSMFLNEDRLEELWPSGKHPLTIRGVIDPIIRGLGDNILTPHVEAVSQKIGLIAGDLEFSSFEDTLSDAWSKCQNGDEAAFNVMTALYRAARTAGGDREADIVLMDVAPNLGAMNRSALISADYVVVPLSSDVFALQGLRTMGPKLREWHDVWRNIEKGFLPDLGYPIPSGYMHPIGYVVTQHAVRVDRPVKAHLRWMGKIPSEFHTSVLNDDANLPEPYPVTEDKFCLATLKHYPSLMPLAMESRKPMFHLRPADGAIGSNIEAVKDCYQDFKKLAIRIAESTQLELPAR